MRTETLWQGQRRAARLRWWRELLDGPAATTWEQTLDEMVRLRFRGGEDGAPFPETDLRAIEARAR